MYKNTVHAKYTNLSINLKIRLTQFTVDILAVYYPTNTNNQVISEASCANKLMWLAMLLKVARQNPF